MADQASGGRVAGPWRCCIACGRSHRTGTWRCPDHYGNAVSGCAARLAELRRDLLASKLRNWRPQFATGLGCHEAGCDGCSILGGRNPALCTARHDRADYGRRPRDPTWDATLVLTEQTRPRGAGPRDCWRWPRRSAARQADRSCRASATSPPIASTAAAGGRRPPVFLRPEPLDQGSPVRCSDSLGASMVGLIRRPLVRRLGQPQVTVVERADSLRPAGPIDVRGRALDTAQHGHPGDDLDVKVSSWSRWPSRMGGPQVATLDLRWFANETGEHDIEITSRGTGFNRILRDIIPNEVEFRFASSIASLVDGADGVDVVFADGRQGRYHLVVGADGLHSTVRRVSPSAGEKGPVRRWLLRRAGRPAPGAAVPRRSPGLTIAVRDAGDGPQGDDVAASARWTTIPRPGRPQRADRAFRSASTWRGAGCACSGCRPRGRDLPSTR